VSRFGVASLVLSLMFVSSILALVPVWAYWSDIPSDLSDGLLDSSASPPGEYFLYRERTLDSPHSGYDNRTGCIRFGNGLYNITLVYVNTSGASGQGVNFSHYYCIKVERDGRVLLDHFLSSDAIYGDKFLVNVSDDGINGTAYSLYDLTGGDGDNHTNPTLDVRTGLNSSWYRLHQGCWDRAGDFFDINATGNLNTSLPLADESSWIELDQAVRLGWNFSAPSGGSPMNVSVVLTMFIEKDYPGIRWTLNVSNTTAHRFYNLRLRPGFWPVYSGSVDPSSCGSEVSPIANGSRASYFYYGLLPSADVRDVNGSVGYNLLAFTGFCIGPEWHYTSGSGGIIDPHDAGYLSAVRVGWPAARQWDVVAGRVTHWNPIVVVNLSFNTSVYVRELNKSRDVWFNIVRCVGNGTSNVIVALDSWNGSDGWNPTGFQSWRVNTMFQVWSSSGTANLTGFEVFSHVDNESDNVAISLGDHLSNNRFFMYDNTSSLQFSNLSLPMRYSSWTNAGSASGSKYSNVSTTPVNLTVWLEAFESRVRADHHGLVDSSGNAFFEYEFWPHGGLPDISDTQYPLLDLGVDRTMWDCLVNQSGLFVAWMGGGNGSNVTADGSQVNWNATFGDGDLPGMVFAAGSVALENAYAGNSYGEWVRFIEQFGSHFYLMSNTTALGDSIPFFDVSWVTLWPVEEKMSTVIPNLDADSGYISNRSVDADSYFYLNYSINNSDVITSDVESEDLFMIIFGDDGPFNASVSPFSNASASWNTSWVWLKDSDGGAGNPNVLVYRIPRTMVFNRSNGFAVVSVRIGNEHTVAQNIYWAVSPFDRLSFLNYDEWTQPGVLDGVTDRNWSSRWTGRLFWTSGCFAQVRYDEDVNGSLNCSTNLTAENWSFGWFNVTVRPSWAAGLSVPSYTGGENVSVVVYFPLQPGCVQGHWPAEVFVNDTELSSVSSLSALDGVLQGYYRDGSDRLLYVKTNTTAGCATVISFWVGNKPPVISSASASGGRGSASVSWSDSDPNGDRLDYFVYYDCGDGVWRLASSGSNGGSASVDLDPGQYRFRVLVEDYSPGHYSYDEYVTGWVTVSAAAPAGVPGIPGYWGAPGPVVLGGCWLCWIFLAIAAVFGVFAVWGAVDDDSWFGGWFGDVRRVWIWVAMFVLCIVVWVVCLILCGAV